MALERSFRFETKRLEEKIRRRLAETPLAERSIMRQIAARMRKEAIARAPKDIGTLEHSILDMVAQTPNGYAAVVYVPVNACVVETSDGRSFSYAVAMHENHYELRQNRRRGQLLSGASISPGQSAKTGSCSTT